MSFDEMKWYTNDTIDVRIKVCLKIIRRVFLMENISK